MQAGVVANLDTNRTQMSALVTSSQSATGALQATQAGNQLAALQAQQLADLTAAVAAQGRAQSLEAAQRTSAQDQGREQLRRFLTPGSRLPTHDRSDVPLMSTHLTSQQFLRVAAVVFVMLAAVVAVIQSRRSEDAAVLAPLEPGEADALVSELARCRTVTPDDAAVLEACRRIWAENRQHFFVSTKSPQLPDPPAPNAPAGLMKSQDRIPPREVDQKGTR